MEQEEEMVQRGECVVGVMGIVGDQKVTELIGETLEQAREGAHVSAQDDEEEMTKMGMGMGMGNFGRRCWCQEPIHAHDNLNNRTYFG
jgi:hypothetical protein